jgi:ribokinase
MPERADPPAPGTALLCIGNITIDEAVQPDGTTTIAPGGDALFAALAARRHLPQVSWLAPVGSDLPTGLLDELQELGLVAVQPDPVDLPTVRNVVTYQADGSRTWDLVHGEDHFDTMSVHPPLSDPVLALLDTTARGRGAGAHGRGAGAHGRGAGAHGRGAGVLVSAMTLRAQSALTGWLREHTSAAIYLDLQEDYLAGNLPQVRAMVSDCDVFLPSEDEALTLAGTSDLYEALAILHDLGPQIVVITRAWRGCLVLAPDESPGGDPGSETVTEIPADVVEPVDSTGAGDAFCGAFAAAHLLGASAVDAARAGSSAARAAVSGPGLLGLIQELRAATRPATGA